ncbi:hypothetical protein FHW36_101520 [Chitinophaga polysaccharea]|uniref:Uncharacterized protein n=1 Tax=Chitinophaga polysaccharea TaxID=1293035 RepID=A0A561Q2M8_9BACT|nr:hypothetical protein [Chitinophaga polysaccharea]TWF44600.1 hypothetical protein FHW36_101520 [Chitinophaga polysaccharea]
MAAVSLILLPACQHTAIPEKEKPVQIDTMQLIAPPAPSEQVASNEVSVVSRDTTTYIRFGNCYFSLDWIKPDAGRNDFERHPDSLFFWLAPSHSIEGQMLAITTGETQRIQVSQRYETSVIIGDEPLRDWKHYRSPWESLPAEASNFFICKKYRTDESTRFPPVSLSLFQRYVKQHASPAAYARVARLSHFPQPPARIAISRYYIRVNGLQRHMSDEINKLLVIDVSFKK